MKLEQYKRSILVSGSQMNNYLTVFKTKYKGKQSKVPKGVIVSKKFLYEIIQFFKTKKVRLYLDAGLKHEISLNGKTKSTSVNLNVSVRTKTKPKSKIKFNPMSEPLLRFYISTMFQKPNSSFAKDELKSKGYTKTQIVTNIKKIPFAKQKLYLDTIDNVW